MVGSAGPVVTVAMTVLFSNKRYNLWTHACCPSDTLAKSTPGMVLLEQAPHDTGHAIVLSVCTYRVLLSD
eukprot:3579253-Amphidinium_carterae.1